MFPNQPILSQIEQLTCSSDLPLHFDLWMLWQTHYNNRYLVSVDQSDIILAIGFSKYSKMLATRDKWDRVVITNVSNSSGLPLSMPPSSPMPKPRNSTTYTPLALFGSLARLSPLIIQHCVFWKWWRWEWQKNWCIPRSLGPTILQSDGSISAIFSAIAGTESSISFSLSVTLMERSLSIYL